MINLVVSYWVILLVVESHTGRVLGSSLVAHSVDEILSLVDDNFVGDIGIFLILDFKLVGGECLDGQVGGQDGSILGHNVGSLCNSSGSDVIKIRFVCLSH